MGARPNACARRLIWRRFSRAQHIALMEGVGSVDPISLDEYVAGSGYLGLADALSMGPDLQSYAWPWTPALLGRGGAYFPAARKWQAARRVNAARRHLVVNAEEGEPGVFKDRHLMEGNPHRIIEGAIIAAYAAGAGNVVIYINAEADLSRGSNDRSACRCGGGWPGRRRRVGQRFHLHGHHTTRRRGLRLR